jgi:hypothetical protein
MNLRRHPRDGARSLERLDTQMDSYLHWRDQARAVSDAYRRWTMSPGHESSVAFERYLAALDLEEFAACRYRRLIEYPQAHGGASSPKVVQR